MKLRITRVCVATALAVLAVHTPSNAFAPVLSAADVGQAVREGTAMVGDVRAEICAG